MVCYLASNPEPFLAKLDLFCEYLERFLHMQSTDPSDPDETAATFQHIAAWTILQFCETNSKFCYLLVMG